MAERFERHRAERIGAYRFQGYWDSAVEGARGSTEVGMSTVVHGWEALHAVDTWMSGRARVFLGCSDESACKAVPDSLRGFRGRTRVEDSCTRRMGAGSAGEQARFETDDARSTRQVAGGEGDGRAGHALMMVWAGFWGRHSLVKPQLAMDAS